MTPFWLPFGARRAKKIEGPRYADILERAVAASIDLLVIYFLFFRMFLLIKDALYVHVDAAIIQQALDATQMSTMLGLYLKSGAPALWLLYSGIQVVVIGLFLVSMQCMWDTTPGKWLFGLRIARRRTFERLTPARYILRFLAYIPATVPLPIGVLWAVFNKEHRGWHDMIAGTVVIRTRPEGWYWGQVKRGYRWVRARMRKDDEPMIDEPK